MTRNQDPRNETPGMEPDARRKFHVNEPGPDEPGAEDIEGHTSSETLGMEPDEARSRATEPSPDEPGGDQPGPDAMGRVKF